MKADKTNPLEALAAEMDPAMLPYRTIFLYTFPMVGTAGVAMLAGAFIPKLYSDEFLLSLTLISVVQFIAGLLATFAIIFVGKISDGLRWNFGRRRPFLLIFAPIATISFALVFGPSESLIADRGRLAVYFCALFSIFTIASSLSDLAYGSLRIELTQDDSQRIQLFTFVGAALVAGVLLGSVVVAILPMEWAIGDDVTTFKVCGLLFGILYGVGCLLLGIFARERKEFWRESVPIVPAFRRCVSNGPFMRYLISGIATATMNSMTVVYVYTFDYVFKVNSTLFIGIYGVMYAVLSAVFVPVWYVLLRRYKWDKVDAFKLSQCFLIVYGVIAFISTYVSVWMWVFAVVFFALWSSGHNIVDGILLADCVDYDELRSGKRREGTYFSINKLPSTYFDIAIKSAPLVIMDALGYDGSLDEQNSNVEFSLRAFLGLAPIITGVAALIIIWGYPINEEVHVAILEAIEQRKLGKSAVNPVTGEILGEGSPKLSDSDDDSDDVNKLLAQSSSAEPLNLSLRRSSVTDSSSDSDDGVHKSARGDGERDSIPSSLTDVASEHRHARDVPGSMEDSLPPTFLSPPPPSSPADLESVSLGGGHERQKSGDSDDELDLEWLVDYFSEREIKLLRTSHSNIHQVVKELYISLSLWLVANVVTVWQAIVLVTKTQINELAFLAIMVASCISFVFAFDLARLLVLRKVAKRYEETRGYAEHTGTSPTGMVRPRTYGSDASRQTFVAGGSVAADPRSVRIHTIERHSSSASASSPSASASSLMYKANREGHPASSSQDTRKATCVSSTITYQVTPGTALYRGKSIIELILEKQPAFETARRERRLSDEKRKRKDSALNAGAMKLLSSVGDESGGISRRDYVGFVMWRVAAFVPFACFLLVTNL